MRILMFAPAFAPYMGSESLVTSKLALALRRAGCAVDVVSRREVGAYYSGDWEAPWTELRDCTQVLAPSSRARRMIEYAGNAVTLGHPVAGLRWAGAAVELGRKMLAENHYDAILSRSPPDVGHLPALVLARETGLPWVANWNDPPLGAWPEPYANGNAVERLMHRRLAKQVIRQASRCSFPSARLAHHVYRSLGMPPETPAAVIPHAALGGESSAVARDKSTFRLCHAGKLCNSRDPRPFLEGVKRFLASERPTAGVFQLEQIGHADRDLLTLSRELGVEGYVSSTGALAYLPTLQRLAQSHVTVLVEAPCEEGIFLPSKIVDYSQTGRPILAASPRNGTVTDLLTANKGGIAVDASSSDSLAAALAQLYRSWRSNDLDEQYGSADLARAFRPDAIVDGYRKVFADLGIAF